MTYLLIFSFWLKYAGKKNIKSPIPVGVFKWFSLFISVKNTFTVTLEIRFDLNHKISQLIILIFS